MRIHKAISQDDFQEYFYEQMGFLPSQADERIEHWSNPETGFITRFGSSADIQCGLGTYQIQQDFMICFDYDINYLHFGIVYNGITYSVIEKDLEVSAVPSAFLTKEKIKGGTLCWKRNQYFKGVEMSIEYHYLVDTLLPFLGYEESNLDFIDKNIRYQALSEEMIDVIYRVEKALKNGTMNKSLLLALVMEFLSYLLNKKNRNYFCFQKQEDNMMIRLGNRQIRLCPWEIQSIIDIYEEIKKNAACISSIYELSRQHQISEQKLKAGFKQIYGQTIWSFGNSLRMRQAIQLIQDTSLTVQNIAFSLGYSSQSAFLRMFKQFYGITPGQFRIQIRKSGKHDNQIEPVCL